MSTTMQRDYSRDPDVAAPATTSEGCYFLAPAPEPAGWPGSLACIFDHVTGCPTVGTTQCPCGGWYCPEHLAVHQRRAGCVDRAVEA